MEPRRGLYILHGRINDSTLLRNITTCRRASRSTTLHHRPLVLSCHRKNRKKLASSIIQLEKYAYIFRLNPSTHSPTHSLSSLLSTWDFKRLLENLRRLPSGKMVL